MVDFVIYQHTLYPHPFQAKKTQREMISNVTFHRVRRKPSDSPNERQKTDEVRSLSEGSIIEVKDKGHAGSKIVGLRRGEC